LHSGGSQESDGLAESNAENCCIEKARSKKKAGTVETAGSVKAPERHTPYIAEAEKIRPARKPFLLLWRWSVVLFSAAVWIAVLWFVFAA